MSFVHEHHKNSLKDHVLEVHVDTDSLKGFYLRDGKRPTSRMMSTLILFTVEGIVILGDLTPSQNGVISCLGYGLNWFGGNLSEHYLCGKFLRKQFVSEKAYRSLREDILRMRRQGSWNKEKSRELWDENEEHGPDGYGGEWSGQEFYTAILRAGLDYDGQGYGYESGEAGWLCALQQKFAELWTARIAAEEEATHASR